MSRLLVTGAPPAGDALLAFYGQGHDVVLASDPARLSTVDAPLADLLIGGATSLETLRALAEQARALDLPWIVWTAGDDRALTLAAYSAGALAVLPATTPPALFAHTVQQMLALTARARDADTPVPASVARRYPRGAVIALEPDMVLQIQTGVVAQSVIHRDGREGLLGLWGPGQIIVGHPEDACCLQLAAQTTTMVTLRPWRIALTDPTFAERLALRLRYMEAWAAAQARPYLDQRLLGVLELLAEQFGLPHPRGTLIDVRVTHAQLAAAIGATRTTVTRLLHALRARGRLALLCDAGGPRWCLPGQACHRHALGMTTDPAHAPRASAPAAPHPAAPRLRSAR